jgi:hypothetical protein
LFLAIQVPALSWGKHCTANAKATAKTNGLNATQNIMILAARVCNTALRGDKRMEVTVKKRNCDSGRQGIQIHQLMYITQVQ